MFAVIYRGYLKPGREQEYQRLWRRIASYFIEQRGAIGSCLHRGPDGLWVAYSRWPSREARDASWPGEEAPSDGLDGEIRQAIVEMKDCLDADRKLPEICLEVVDDLIPK